MLKDLTGWHALIILAIVVLIFGAAKLPALAKSVGQSVRILKKEVGETGGDATAAQAASAGASPGAPAASAGVPSVLPTNVVSAVSYGAAAERDSSTATGSQWERSTS